MKSNSTVNPVEITPDMGSLTPEGYIDVLVHWNISDVMGPDGVIYSYEEERVSSRPLPAGVRSETDVTAYLASQKERLFLLAGAEVYPDRLTAAEDMIAALVEGSV